jgi:predicted metal-dependent peptidase
MIQVLPESIQAARLSLIKRRPYLASILWSMIPVARTEKDGLDTMAVDRYARWYINIEKVNQWPIPMIALAIIHEISHLMRRHHDRMQQFNGYSVAGGISLANWGGDLEINDDLIAEAQDFQTTAPEGWLYPKLFDFPNNLLAEEYCDLLIKKAKKDGKLRTIPGNSNAGAGKCGSCSGSDPKEWEEGPPPGVDGGTADSLPGLTPAEMDVTRRQVAEAIKQHSTAIGKVPAGWSRWADRELVAPKVHWTREFAAIVRRAQAEVAGMVNYSFSKPSKRSNKRIILPGLRKPKIDAVGVLDTSGSMSEADLDRSLSEFAGIMKQVGLDGMRYVSVDAAATVGRRVFKASQINLVGGGGTDMRVGISAAMAMKPKPDIVIVFTDGYTPWPSEPVRDTKIIALLTRAGAMNQVPGWIRAILAEASDK